MRYMKQAARERELTTVASLHQVNIAREFGDRFIGVRDGTVIFDGSRAELSMDVIDDLYYAGSESTPVSHGDIEGQGEGLTKPDDTSVSSDMETTSGRDHSTGTDTDTDTETDTGEAQL